MTCGKHPLLQKMAALLLLALCASMAQGIAFNSEASRKEGIAVNSEASKKDGRRKELAARRASALRAQVAYYEKAIEHRANLSKGPLLVPPHVSMPAAGRPSLLGVDSSSALNADSEFQPSAEFENQGRAAQGSELPWGIGTPRTGDNWPVHEWSAMHMLDVPKWVEYSLETGDNIQTFSSAWQDVKLITQVFENVTNGFYLDSHGGDGEMNSYTLLLELTGWRGLILEPQVYEFATLWGKMRKAWLFLGCISPTGNATKIGFDTDGVIDMMSGHQIHAYNLPTFLEELGGRKSIDFWALHNGHYEAEVLNETFFYSGKNIEFGVILVRFEGRNSGRGFQPYVLPRSKDATEELIFEIFHNASYVYIGGLDAYWVNYIEPRFHYMDHVWVNPAYFERRGIPVPTVVKSAPPPALKYPRPGHLDVPGYATLQKWEGSGSNAHPNQVYGSPTDKKAGPIPLGYGSPGIPYGPSTRDPFGIDHQVYDEGTQSVDSTGARFYGDKGGGGTWDPRWNWDAGYNYEEETSRMIAYMAKAKADAAATEAPAKAHRVQYNRLMSVEGR